MNSKLIQIGVAQGITEAQIIKSLFKAYDIELILRTESAAQALGMGVGPLAEVILLVYPEQLEQAETLLNDYYDGRLDED
jgi:hypothetical protein